MYNSLPNTCGLALLLFAGMLVAGVQQVRAEEQFVDAHGIVVSLDNTDSEKHLAEFSVNITSDARDLIVEEATSASFDHADEWARIGTQDLADIQAAIGKCWRSYLHYCHNKELKHNELMPCVKTIKEDRGIATEPDIFSAKCDDGYFVEFRPPSTVYAWKSWWCQAGREFRSQAGDTIRVVIDVRSNGQSIGSVELNGEQLLKAPTGSETFDGEVSRRVEHAERRRKVNTLSFQTTYARLRCLCGDKWDSLLHHCTQNDGDAQFALEYRIAPHATVKAVENLRVFLGTSLREQNSAQDSNTGRVQATSGVSMQVPSNLAASLSASTSSERSQNRTNSETQGKEATVSFELSAVTLERFPKRDPNVFALALFAGLKHLSLIGEGSSEAVTQYMNTLLSEAEIRLKAVPTS